MAQDPKKEAKEVERTSLKDKLKQVSPEKKAPLKKVAEMGKPSLMPKFEAAMQKERDFVLNRAKQREESGKENKKEYFGSVLKELPSKEVMVPIKKKPLKSMSKKSSIFEKITDAVPSLYGFKLKNKNN
jgi:hypothetical protein